MVQLLLVAICCILLIMWVLTSCFCPAANHLWLLLFPILKQFEEDRYGQFVANNLPISSSKKRHLNEQIVACRNVKMVEMLDLGLILQYIIRIFCCCGCIIRMKLPSFVCMQKPSSHLLWFAEIWIFIRLIGHKTQCLRSGKKYRVGSWFKGSLLHFSLKKYTLNSCFIPSQKIPFKEKRKR